MDAVNKKALKSAYKNRTVIGGVCAIRCSGNQRLLIQATKDLDGLQNRFNFALAAKSCPDPSLRSECAKYGVGSFSFSVLETLTKGEDQTDREFSDELSLLHEIWLEKAQRGDL